MIDTSIKADEIPMEKDDKVNFCAQKRIDGPAKLWRVSCSAKDGVQGMCLVRLSRDGYDTLITFAYHPACPMNWPENMRGGDCLIPVVIPAGKSLFAEVTNGGEVIMNYTRP